MRLTELKDNLLEQGYNEAIVDIAFDKARTAPRIAALKKVSKAKKV